MVNIENSAILLALLPVVAIIGLTLNLFIRARGGRSFRLRLKGFGIDLSVETIGNPSSRKGNKHEPED